jgi:hypothetical protein
MNDTHIDTHNPIFKTLQVLNTRQQHTQPICYIKTAPKPKDNHNSSTQHTTHAATKSKYILNYAKQQY